VTLPKLQVCWIVKISRKNAVLSFIPAFASQKKNLLKKKKQHSFSDCFPGRFHECLRLPFASFTDEKNCPVRSDLKDSRMK